MFQNLERNSMYLGNLVGVPIFLHWSAIFLLFMVWSGSSGGIEGVILVLIALILGIVLHELGHGLMARALGAFGITITLWAFGGLCRSSRDRSTIGREMAIVAAGPAVSLALWLGCRETFTFLATQAPELIQGSRWMLLLAKLLAISALVNKSLFFFNMMPIFPMDGGQLVFLGAWGVTRNQLLSRQIALFLAIFGSIAFFGWRTELFDIMQQPGGNIGQWMAGLSFGDFALAVMLALMVRSAWTYLR